MFNLPNFLTLIRILIIPFFLALLSSELYLEALVVLILGGLTDALDGAIARMRNQRTLLGAYLDPVADKLLVMSSFVMLGYFEAIPRWLVILVVSRDLVILLGYAMIYFLVEERLDVRPSFAGKLNTLIQLLTVGAALIFLYAPAFLDSLLLDAFVLATAAMTVVSGLQYTYRGLAWLLHSRTPSVHRSS